MHHNPIIYNLLFRLPQRRDSVLYRSFYRNRYSQRKERLRRLNMENSSSSVPSSKCIQILQKIDTGNQCFEIPVGNSKTLKNIGIDNRALQILMSNGLYVAKQNINSVRIKRVK